MPVILPTFIDVSTFQETVSLDEVLYVFVFKYNTRYDFWTFSILDIDQNPIISGIKAVLSYEMIANFVDRSIPPGALIAFDLTGKELRINRDNLGVIAEVFYYTKAEV